MAIELCGPTMSVGEKEWLILRGSDWLNTDGEKFVNNVNFTVVPIGGNASDLGNEGVIDFMLNQDEITVTTEDGDVVVPALEGVRFFMSGMQGGNYQIEIHVDSTLSPRHLHRVVNVLSK